MRFVINSAEWRFDGKDTATMAEAIERLLDRLDVAAERGEVATYSEYLTTDPVYKNDDLWALFDPSHEFQLSHDILERLSTAISRMPRWDECYALTHLDVERDGVTICSPDLAWAHARACDGHRVACLTLDNSGIKATIRVDGVAQDICFVNSEQTHREFFRFVIQHESRDWSDFGTLAPSAWPDIHHFADVWSRVRDMKDLSEWRKDVMDHLDVLDKSGTEYLGVGNCGIPSCSCVKSPPTGKSNQSVIRNFANVGIPVGPENPATMKSSIPLRQRTVDGPPKLVFEWHSKLHGHKGRLHFHPALPTDPQKRIVLGIVARHLDT